jgi:nucleoside diphosphate kinase
MEGLFNFRITDEEYDAMAEIINVKNSLYEFSQIVKYMTGIDPKAVSPSERDKPGEHRALALLYRGPNAVETIRERLGVTDPAIAAEGTIRSDFGQNIMQNAAHASDSVENAVRERKIIGFYDDAGNDCKRIIENWLKDNRGSSAPLKEAVRIQEQR